MAHVDTATTLRYADYSPDSSWDPPGSRPPSRQRTKREGFAGAASVAFIRMGQREEEFERLYLAYARAMAEAQHFESTLQMVAAMELGMFTPEMTSEERQETTERVFSRGVHWIQTRLDLSPEIAAEMDALRQERNTLAHGYLVRIEFSWPDPGRLGPNIEDRLPDHLRDEMEATGKIIAAEYSANRIQATKELHALRERFKACAMLLSSRWMSHIKGGPNWEEAEREFIAENRELRGESKEPPRGRQPG